VATLVVYVRVAGNDFIALDDPAYVYQNEHVLGGLTTQGIRWAFNTYTASNWHPLTWLSHMADVQLFGTSPGGHHLTSAVLHAFAAVFLFAALNRMTGKRWASGLVAALFALHPLRSSRSRGSPSAKTC
jgi:protein O-mannosyl-transferase